MTGERAPFTGECLTGECRTGERGSCDVARDKLIVGVHAGVARDKV